MNVIKISDERIDAILPKSIKDSDVLNKNDKKVLGAILHYFLVLDKAKVNKYVILTNEDLRKTVCIRKSSVLTSVQNLIELGLIKRECGKTWTEGEKPQASKYYVNWNNLKKPLKKPTFEDLFSDFISSETPLGTIDIDTDSDTDSDTDKEIDKEKDSDKENGDMDMMENATRGKVVKSEDLTNSKNGIEQNKDNSSTGDMDMEIRNIDGFSDFSFSSIGDTGESKVSAVSDNGTSVKNAENKNITSTQRTGNNSSTQGNIITSTSGNGEHKVQSGNVISDSSIFSENCPKPYLTPQIPLTPLSFPNKATGEPQTEEMDNLSTQYNKTQPEPRECPQIELNKFPPTTKDIENKINGNAGAWDSFFDKLLEESA